MNNIVNLPPFKRFCMSIGNVPNSYIESLTYQELLYWLCEYLSKTVIPTINNNSEATKEIQDLFNKLQNYVNHYFESLDVQEEINKKLNQMSENGELQNILSNFLNINPLIIFNDTESLKNSNFLIEGNTVKTLGLNDDNQSYYKISSDISSSNFIKLKNNLYANKLINKIDYNLKNWGANFWPHMTLNEQDIRQTILNMKKFKMNTLYIAAYHELNEDKINFTITVTDAMIKKVISIAQELGIENIIIKPHLKNHKDIINSEAFIDKWYNRIVQLISLSSQYNLSTICLSNELKLITPFHKDKWLSLINFAKSQNLKTMVAFQGFREFYNCCFIDDLDIIGINYYPPINEKFENLDIKKALFLLGNTDFYQEKNNFYKIKKMLNGKNVIISEFGCQSNIDSLKKPDQYDNFESGLYNQDIQALYYDTFITMFKNCNDLINGIIIWEVGPGLPSFDYKAFNPFQNEKTLKVLEKYNFKGDE